MLLGPTRDWRVVIGESVPAAMTPAASALLAQLPAHARAHGWNPDNLAATTRVLRVLLGRLGAAAPLPEVDVRAVARAVRKGSAHRALHFLVVHHTVTRDPSRRISVHERAVDAQIIRLPPGIGSELRVWVRVQRGLGRWPHPALRWAKIRAYLATAIPVFTDWAPRGDSLRQITAADIRVAVGARNGNAAHALRTALRSIFRSLKQERVIFTDPTRGASRLAAVATLPASIPGDNLRGLIDRVDGSLARLAVTLVAVHALGVTDLRNLRVADLDSRRGSLSVARVRGRPHRIYLDTLTHQACIAWLLERQRRWPLTGNEHLLLSDHSAASIAARPIATATLQAVFRHLGITPAHLRQDRILREAADTADPVHLMRLFGISIGTAMRYLNAAHPERHT